MTCTHAARPLVYVLTIYTETTTPPCLRICVRVCGSNQRKTGSSKTERNSKRKPFKAGKGVFTNIDRFEVCFVGVSLSVRTSLHCQAVDVSKVSFFFSNS